VGGGTGGVGGTGGAGGGTGGVGGTGGAGGGTGGMCAADFADCNNDSSDGCEADLTTPATCGACDHACSSPANAASLCDQGTCSFACNLNFDDCDKQGDNGCEADLTNPATCGACNNPCVAPANSDATCDGGTCGSVCKPGFVDCDEDPSNGCELEGSSGQCPVLTLKSGLDFPNTVVLDATSVYWVNSGTPANKYHDGSLMKMPLNGGSVTVLASNQDTPKGLAINATHVYWTTENRDANRVGTIRSIPLDGGTVTVLASDQASPQTIALDNQSIYWTNAGTPTTYTDGSLVKMPIEGGPVTLLSTNQAKALGLALDAERVYWTTSIGGAVRSMKLDGSDYLEHVTGQLSPQGLVVSGTDLFWSEVGAGFLWTLSLASNDPPKTLVNNASFLLAVDADFVYSGHYQPGSGTGAVSRTKRDGSEITTISKQAYPYAMAVNSKHVYWSNQGTLQPGTGSINRAPKNFVAQ
jgi:hypothetical protein